MHCLRWWLPVFLLPLPAASPFMMILFAVTFALRTKPCSYCSVIIVGLLCSSCAFYSTAEEDVRWQQSTSGGEEVATKTTAVKNNAGGSVGVAQRLRFINRSRNGATANSHPDLSLTQTANAVTTQTPEEPAQQSTAWSSCWFDLAAIGAGSTSSDQQQHMPDKDETQQEVAALGWWSRPTRRRRPTALRRRAASAAAAANAQAAKTADEGVIAAAAAVLGQTFWATTLGRAAASAADVSNTWRTRLRGWSVDTRRNGLLIGTDEQTGFRIKWIID